MDDVQPVNSEIDVIGPTSENSLRHQHQDITEGGLAVPGVMMVMQVEKNLHKRSKERKKFLKAKKMIMQKV